MDDYIIVQNSFFQFITIGQYIRWETGGIVNSGGTIQAVGITSNGRYNWQTKGHRGTYTLYWDTIGSVYVRKDIYFHYLSTNIKGLSLKIDFLIEELGLTEKFEEYHDRIKEILKDDMSVVAYRENEKRLNKIIEKQKK